MEKISFSGSYDEGDVVFLLKVINGLIIEKDNTYRETAIQGGTHYSEMLPIEYQPSSEYMELFYSTLEQNKHKIASLTQILSEKILKLKGRNLVLVSLARAGTPLGILIKRYFEYKYCLTVPHYSISIIRDRGIDENAVSYILEQHSDKELIFIDGWTGKGVIQDTLIDACSKYNEKYGTKLDSMLGVLSDPAYCTNLYATREDFLIPSACLNSTVSGLMSRTVLNSSIIGPTDFHGAKFYKELENIDVSKLFINTITEEFNTLDEIFIDIPIMEQIIKPYRGLVDISNIKNTFKIENINLIKPGIGETTRVLLRRIPWCILVDSIENPLLKHILRLAQERNVPVKEYSGMSYSCCGIIKPMDSSDI